MLRQQASLPHSTVLSASALQELLGYYLGKGNTPVRFVAFLISFYW